MNQTRKIQVKWRYILIGILVFLLMMIPFPVHDATGTTVKYVAVLWSFRRDKVVLEEDVGGEWNHVKYRIVYRGRIFVFPYAIEDDEIRYAQW
ncbi:hypothetical protein [Ruminococcus sp.]|uniref:hypothetical protein n=1 Tax=Ruminococcus sp. TaxID=41978 RepID=UPI0025CD07F3|nr:hypothetical protein [Ruminococcus sp.]